MKKILKFFLWFLAVLAGILLIAALIFFVRFRKATKVMTTGETMAINDSVWCIKDNFVNAFVFKGDSGYLMVDAGISKKNFQTELKKFGISTDQITTLLLTHTDSDHTGAVPLLKNAKIYLHKEEEQMINGTTGKMKFLKLKWKYGPYTLLNSNDSLNIDGLKITIIHTPGHTPGSSCFIIGKDYFVTGDNLIVKDKKYEHFVEMFNMDTPMQIESLKLLPAPQNFKYILTSHNGIIETSE